MKANDKILGDNGSKEAIEAKGEPDFSKTATTDEGMFAALDNDGTSYYYRGAVENNWLYFAGYYWRIIRINGDGSIRVIYSGTSTSGVGSDTQIGTGVFNSNYDKNEYAGLKYTLGEQHGNSTNSTILDYLNNWYASNLLDYSNYIAIDAGFCSDREMATGFIWESQPSTTINYKATERLNNNNPSLNCNAIDLFTVKNSSIGNKSLLYPIGLLTADEAAMAGGLIGGYNPNYYLYTGENYWLLTPNMHNGNRVYIYRINSSGHIGSVHGNLGIRPVINLKKDVMLSGDGTKENPYKIVN